MTYCVLLKMRETPSQTDQTQICRVKERCMPVFMGGTRHKLYKMKRVSYKVSRDRLIRKIDINILLTNNNETIIFRHNFNQKNEMDKPLLFF